MLDGALLQVVEDLVAGDAARRRRSAAPLRGRARRSCSRPRRGSSLPARSCSKAAIVSSSGCRRASAGGSSRAGRSRGEPATARRRATVPVREAFSGRTLETRKTSSRRPAIASRDDLLGARRTSPRCRCGSCRDRGPATQRGDRRRHDRRGRCSRSPDRSPRPRGSSGRSDAAPCSLPLLWTSRVPGSGSADHPLEPPRDLPFGCTPTIRSISRPCRSTRSVGMLWTPKRAAVAGFSSTFSFATRTRPDISPPAPPAWARSSGRVRTTAPTCPGAPAGASARRRRRTSRRSP